MVALSLGCGALVGLVGGYPIGQTLGSFIILGLGIYFMITLARHQFPWPLFMILPAAFSVVRLFGWSQALPAGTFRYGVLIVVGVALLLRPRKTNKKQRE